MNFTEATNETRALALEMLIWGSTVEEFASKHKLSVQEILDYIALKEPVTRIVGITLASRLGLLPYYFETTVPRVRSQYKATELKRIAALKDLIGSQPEAKLSEKIEKTWMAIEKYLSGSLKLDKNNGRKLALKLGLAMNYFDITPPSGDYLPPVPHATILEQRKRITKVKSETPRNYSELQTAVSRFHYKATNSNRLLVLKELLGDQSVDDFAEKNDLNVNKLNQILSSAIQLDRLLARRLALRLGLGPGYFEVTPPSVS